ncbi:MAG TPA: hypothetical protein VNY31_05585 [Solirubrobacteraceae bacterium]|nr:hypothetical protein [Solirubrobacteraceae bacterium]
MHDGTLGRDDARHLLTDGQVADGDDQFWDVQALRRAHVVRIVSASAIECQPLGGGEWITVATHLLLHEAGLALIRLTLDPSAHGTTIDMPQLAGFSDAVWQNQRMVWRVALADHRWELDADVRRVMDAVMLPLHERFCGRQPDIFALRQLETPEERYQWLDERVDAGESLSAYPQTFGTAYELVWDTHTSEQESLRSVAELAYGTRLDARESALLTPAETGYGHDWFIGENRAVLALAGGRDRSALDTFDALRTQTLEYLTLQRAALRAVQRATQLTITERRTINRKQLQEWQRLVAALTDEYVLHDQVATVLRPLRKHMAENPLLRDPDTLAMQVRQNLGTFQDLIEAASHRVAIFLSGLFGVVAAITLAPLAHEIELAIFQTGGSVSGFNDRHIVLSIGVDVLLLLVVAAMSFGLIARTNRLRWPKR